MVDTNQPHSTPASPATSSVYRPPQIDRILRHPRLTPWLSQPNHKPIRKIVAAYVRHLIEERRHAGGPFVEKSVEEDLDDFAAFVAEKLQEFWLGKLQPVINGTGIIINTNLGRAPLPENIGKSLEKILSSYCNLELDLTSGQRGDRNNHVELLLKLVTGCEAALVVNNNAASVMLAIAALAYGRDVIISRGELVEIGGSFRLPDVIVAAGGLLKEVGTTNRTNLQDYANAITASCGMILKCHQSNFEQRGFVAQTTVPELAKLGQLHSIPIVEDLGSGCLIDIVDFGFKQERRVQDSLKEGASACLFSGDKLLGGPQAGLIVGSKQLIEKMRHHPIYRAVRPDKFSIAFLEAALSLYWQEDIGDQLPIAAMAKETSQAIYERLMQFIASSHSHCPSCQLVPLETESAFGGGTSPGQVKPSWGLAITAKSPAKIKAEEIANILRQATPPVIVRIQKGTPLIDFRTVRPSDEKELLTALSYLDRAIAAP